MLSGLQLRNFRNFNECDLEVTPGATLFRGRNGQGKTNLLEAVYYLSSLRSFRQAAGAQLVRNGASAFEVHGKLREPAGEELRVLFEERKRQLELNGNHLSRAIEFVG